MINVDQYLKKELKIKTVPEGDYFVCMFSGGKDSALALSLMIDKKAILFELIHCVDCKSEKAEWHKQSVDFAYKQANAMGANINILKASVAKNRYEFISSLKKYSENGIKYIVFGDLKLGDQTILEIICSKMAGMIPVMPLWNMDYSEIIKLQEEKMVLSVITYIEDPNQIDIKYLGMTLDKNVYEDFELMGIDIMGEDGEYHTTIVGMKNFISQINFDFGEIIHRNDGVLLNLY